MTISRRRLLIGGGTALAGLGAAGWLGWRQMGTAGQMAAHAARQRQSLSVPATEHELIRYATLAANGHNTQPWLFRADARGIDILPDTSRRTPVVDPDDHHLFVSLGCAVENLALAAAAMGRGGGITFAPTGDGAVRFHFGTNTGSGDDAALFDAIPLRQSTRSDYDGSAVNTTALAQLEAAGAMPGVDLTLINQRRQIDQIRDLVVAANAAQLADPAFVAELKHWLRFSPDAAMALGDGLYSPASGHPALPDWLGRRLFDMVFTPGTESAKIARQIDTSSGIAVFVAQRSDPEHWVQVGRACQRFALQATALGLRTAHINQPAEVPALRAALANVAGLPGRRPDIVMRFGRAPAMPFSARRLVDAVMV
ncbi:MAG: Tat pathway signal protein [Pseudotabrizicola sp.]|uniref:Acg family FMN-binding oxidoreductase n=1 Tax=Pseudotabrizicola sp. TaxID=2939647 RepID=UPI00272F88FA|nr:Tat pathway signal protein [Pseudotabrizicola sp.]MDP2079706.1 Tat pathway signal protein [Pseudotabrizicola sp.]MDZ7574241.1 Tat pathway signal protein [Pseudotabrizicola sp.]